MNDAINYAKSQADLFKQSLQYLVEQQNQQKLLDEQALNQRYTNLVNQINQKRLPIEQQFGQDTQGAYINKLLGQKQIESNLSRMGLSSSGFGLTQQAQNEIGYGQNLNALTLNRNNQLSGINNEITNIEGQRLTDFLGLQSQYTGRLGELNQYITKSVDEKYNQEYANFMKNKEFEEMLKQQAWDNDYKNRALKASSSRNSGWTSSGGGGTPLFTDNNPVEPSVDKLPVNNPSTTITDPNKKLRITQSPGRLSSKEAMSYYSKNVVDKMTYSQLEKHLDAGLARGIYTQDDVLWIIGLIEKSNMISSGRSGGGNGGGGGF